MADLTPYPSSPRSPLRVGEAERAAACDALAEHFSAGRLDPAELDDRLARAMAARTHDDLRVLFVDLAPRRTVPAAVHRDEPRAPLPAGVLGFVLVLSLLLAGCMLLALGLYDAGLALAALVGGTATAVAGACTVVLAQAVARRPR